MTNTLTESEITFLRKEALRISRELNPNTKSGTQHYGLAMQNEVAPSIEKVISDADRIFFWLTSGNTI